MFRWVSHFLFKPLAITGWRTSLPVILTVGLLCSTQMAWAQSAYNVSVKATGGLTTYKSQMLQSNDTGLTIGYGIEVSTGGESGMAMGLERETSSIAFALNGSTLALQVQDVDFTYRWGALYLGLLFGSSSWNAKAPPDGNADKLLDQNETAQEYLDIMTTGYGIKTGLLVPIGRRSTLSMDLRYAMTSTVQQTIPEETSTGGITGTSPALGRVVTLGPRMAIDLGASFPLTRDVLSLMTGYRYRTYSVTVESTSFSELHTSTYLGLVAGWDF